MRRTQKLGSPAHLESWARAFGCRATIGPTTFVASKSTWAQHAVWRTISTSQGRSLGESVFAFRSSMNAPVERIEAWLAEAGFADVRVSPKPESREMIATWATGRGIENLVASATVEARKPL